VTATAKKILEDALTLSGEDRRRVAETLLESVPRDAADDAERLWTEEALRRATAVERGEIEPLDGEQALLDIEAKLRLVDPR
jgi:hypothetical protein